MNKFPQTRIRSLKRWDISLYLFQTCLLIIAITIICLKLFKWEYSFKKLIPESTYRVQLAITYSSHNESVHIATYLPKNDDRQYIMEESHSSGGMQFSYEFTDKGRLAHWEGNPGSGPQRIVYDLTLSTKQMIYQIPGDLQITDNYPPGFSKYLEQTKTIQTNHPTIVQVYKENVPDTTNLLAVIDAIYNYTSGLKPKSFKGVTDAVTAARLGEASCNGKSRLFIALARRAGIPSRLVGGLVLSRGTKRTSHQWVELYIKGHWIPFDALNGHFAEIPKKYLQLYLGDEFLFTHTSEIGFNYLFKVRKQLKVSSAFKQELASHPFNAYKAWDVFQRLGISLTLLNIIIMIPLGAFIISIFRNVIGFETFGTFLPALIAAACRETGLAWGIIGFLLVILIIAATHYPLERWRILHNPKMCILMILVVSILMTFTVIGAKLGLGSFTYISLFPIAVLTITSERFAQTVLERGWARALGVMAMTIVVIAAAYVAMNSLALQSFFLAFPELYLILIVLNLWLGRWIGLRMSEFIRFRWLASQK